MEKLARNIVLVGFMGTGKTSAAKTLAKKLKMKYVSTDDVIEKREGMPITEIFSTKGEAYFRRIEKAVVKKVSRMGNVVIDAGGGVVMDAENMKNLKENGILFCLWATPRVILERTGKYATRPLLNVKNPLGRISELLKKRRPFYKKADYHIRTAGKGVGEVVGLILKRIKREERWRKPREK